MSDSELDDYYAGPSGGDPLEEGVSGCIKALVAGGVLLAVIALAVHFLG